MAWNILASDPSLALAEPPLGRQQEGEDQEEDPVVPDPVLDRPGVVGERGDVERFEVLGQLLGGEEAAFGRLGDLPEQAEIGRWVLQLAVVLVDEEPGRVAAEVLAVLRAGDCYLVRPGRPAREI